MTHRNQHRRPVSGRLSTGRAPLASFRPWSSTIVRLAFTALALVAWLWLIAPAFAQDSTPTSSDDTYTVRPGDTMSQIAKDYETTVSELLRLNELTDSDALYVGQVLKIPHQGEPDNQGVYSVHQGESLADIADAFGVPLSLLMAQNGIRNAESVEVGTKLLIPMPPGSGESALPPDEEEESKQEATSANTPTPQNTATPTLRVMPTSTRTILIYTPAATPTLEPIIVDGPQPDATMENGLWIHVVKAGETASEIAKLYGVPLANLLNVNGIGDANVIRLGARLVIPGSNRWSVGAPPATVSSEEVEESIEPTSTPEATGEPVLSETSTPTPRATLAPTRAPTETPKPTEAPTHQVTETPTSLPSEETISDLTQAIPTPAPLSDRPAASLNRAYTVRGGDSLTSIAAGISVDVAALARLNWLEVDSPLRAGQELLLPATDRELKVVSAAQQYVVKPGDSLSAIARQFGITTDALMATNRIANPNLVSVGAELEIPGKTVMGEGPLKRVGPTRSGYYFYTVKPGDTLSELAADFKSTEIALMEFNNIADAATIYNGMELRVPFGAPSLPQRTPPVPLSGTSFIVSLSRQQCWVFSGREVEYAWNCSTGDAEHRTKAGSFAVKSKMDMAQSNVWRLDMPYWLGIYDVGTVENGIHGLPISWRTGRKIWTELIGEPATFGCAMLDDENAEILYHLAYIGMPVHILR